jgi:uncharacterized protein
MKFYKFDCFGHKNILGTHKNTLEFTKETDLTINGDCIVGVNANYNNSNLLKFIQSLRTNKVNATIIVDNLIDKINFTVNKDFNDKKEIVIRITDFVSSRTFGTRCNKAAINLKRNIIKKMKSEETKMTIIFKENETFRK